MISLFKRSISEEMSSWCFFKDLQLSELIFKAPVSSVSQSVGLLFRDILSSLASSSKALTFGYILDSSNLLRMNICHKVHTRLSMTYTMAAENVSVTLMMAFCGLGIVAP